MTPKEVHKNTIGKAADEVIAALKPLTTQDKILALSVDCDHRNIPLNLPEALDDNKQR